MPELTVVLPTLNERANITAILQRLREVLAEIDYEIIVVDDDSPDGTAELVRSIAQSNSRVRVIQRINRRGLSSACIEGMMASSSPYIAVMDADLQHDERILPAMLARIRGGDMDIVVGSRHAEGGSMGEFAHKRVALSEMGRKLGHLIARVPVSDLMSGYFIVRRTYVELTVRDLSGKGFKVLLDLLASGNRPRVTEISYAFRNRLAGESKLDILAGLEYLELLLDKSIGAYLPVRYVLFALVGGIGVALQILLTALLSERLHMGWQVALGVSASITIAVNFFLNNQLTFRSLRLKGGEMIRGLCWFYAACVLGLVANLLVATYLRSFQVPWYAASAVGLGIGSMWNYSVTTVTVWDRRRRKRNYIFRRSQVDPTVQP
jgi:dolichol-phosphate mannosyltransferase